MKLTNRQIVSAVPALNALNVMKLPVKTSFRVVKASRVLDEALEDYNKTLKKLQEEYAEKDDDGKMKVEEDKIIFDDFEGFEEAFNELLDIENEFCHYLDMLKPIMGRARGLLLAVVGYLASFI